jgi:hypothetical protein
LLHAVSLDPDGTLHPVVSPVGGEHRREMIAGRLPHRACIPCCSTNETRQ